ncbi:MAG TPA: hypothetical protein VHX17_11075 [Candidatus Cybelea sp.]|jgi:hypothetical protein|nr:hypothetical protein [Candidatus Cybelea sp.]
MNALLLATLVAAAHPTPSAPPVCTAETLSVEGTPVTISYCAAGPPRTTASHEIIVPAAATFAAPGGTLRRSSELHFLAEEATSRVLESLDLTKLGLSGTLHLTLAYVRGAIRVEGALLTPGAITIK